MPSKPPKWYNKDKSIDLFVLTHKGCVEIVRGKIGSKGNIYVLTVPQTQKAFPLHKSLGIIVPAQRVMLGEASKL